MAQTKALVASVIAGTLLGAICGCGDSTSAGASHAAQPQPAAQVDRVTAGPLSRKTLTLYTAQPGRIEAFHEAPLFPKLTGYVEEVLVDIGDSVKKDQTLILLWVPELRDEKEQKEALVAQAEAKVKQAEAAVQAGEASIASAVARVDQAEAGIGRAEGEYQRWESEYERMKELAAKGSVTQKLADESLNQFRAAEAARHEAAAVVQSARAGLHEAQAGLAKLQADLVAAQAQHRVAQADLKQITTMLGYMEIKAPFDGVVTQRNVDVGHYVRPASGSDTKPLLVVARTDRVRIFVDVPEMEAPLVDGGENGDPVIVRVQSLRDQEFNGTVTRTSWALDASNRSLRTEIDLPNAHGLLRPGMYVTATILLQERKDVLALPITAIVRNGKEVYCCTVASGKIKQSPVTLGLRSGGEVEVLSGLDERDIVVLARAESLQQDQPVEVIEAE